MTTTIDLPEGPREFPCFQIDGHIVPLTYRELVRGAPDVEKLRETGKGEA